jgi:hypothetical protein
MRQKVIHKGMAITLRGLPEPIDTQIRKIAKEEGVSLNKAVIRFLEKAVGRPKKRSLLHHDLDRFAGSWTAEEASRFEAALLEQRRIDPEAWK